MSSSFVVGRSWWWLLRTTNDELRNDELRTTNSMKLLVLSERDVEELLTMRECIGVMEEALTALARGEVHQPLRSIVRPEGASGFLGLMPAYRGGAKAAFGLKEIC